MRMSDHHNAATGCGGVSGNDDSQVSHDVATTIGTYRDSLSSPWESPYLLPNDTAAFNATNLLTSPMLNPVTNEVTKDSFGLTPLTNNFLVGGLTDSLELESLAPPTLPTRGIDDIERNLQLQLGQQDVLIERMRQSLMSRQRNINSSHNSNAVVDPGRGATPSSLMGIGNHALYMLGLSSVNEESVQKATENYFFSISNSKNLDGSTLSGENISGNSACQRDALDSMSAKKMIRYTSTPSSVFPSSPITNGKKQSTQTSTPLSSSDVSGNILSQRSASSLNDPPVDERRNLHNMSQRRRRDDLRAAFENLSRILSLYCSPTTSRTAKESQPASKLSIINRAIDHVYTLEKRNVEQEHTIKTLSDLLAKNNISIPSRE